MKKILSRVLPISLAAVLVLGLIPAVGVKAATIPEGDVNGGNQWEIIDNDNNPIPTDLYVEVETEWGTTQPERNPDYANYIRVARMDATTTVTSIEVSSESKTLTFTNLNSSGIDIDAEGWTVVFNGENVLTNRLICEMGTTTIVINPNSSLEVSAGGEGLFGTIALDENTVCTPELPEDPYKGNGGFVFTNKTSAEDEKKEDTPAEEEKKEETPAEEPAKEETKEETTAPTELKILDGANQEVDGTGDVTIRANGEFANFDKLLMDDKEVDPSNYDKKEGSTIVTLKAAYVASLGAGAHTVSFVYKDGSAVKTTLTLKAAANSEAAPAAENTSTPAATPAPAAAATDSVAPKTGENIMWIFVILAMSALGMGVTAVSIKKNK